jgi:hypothetical protein
MSTLKELVEKYGLGITVKSKNCKNNFIFRVLHASEIDKDCYVIRYLEDDRVGIALKESKTCNDYVIVAF